MRNEGDIEFFFGRIFLGHPVHIKYSVDNFQLLSENMTKKNQN